MERDKMKETETREKETRLEEENNRLREENERERLNEQENCREKDLEREAISRWSNFSLVKMNRILRGQDPNPPKTVKATKERWKTLPMPRMHSTVKMNIWMNLEDFENIEMGHIPDAMEDHWFMYCDERHVRWYRSWTGICIFDASYKKLEDRVMFTTLRINRRPDQFSSNDDEADVNLFLALMAEEIGINPEPFWQNYWNKKK